MKPQRIGETHSFQVEIAVQVGIEKAILLKEIYGWCHMNLARQKNIFSGIPFSYNPARAFAEKFPYVKEKSIARWLKELEDEQWIYTANFNQNAYDRTKWYAIDFERYDSAIKGEQYAIGTWSEYVKSISQNEKWKYQNDISKYQNDISKSQNETTIPSPTHTTNTSLTKVAGKVSFNDESKAPISDEIVSGMNNVQTPHKTKDTTAPPEDIEAFVRNQSEFFAWFWKTYDKRISEHKCIIALSALDYEECKKIIEVLPKYIRSTPDKKYRASPLRWIEGKRWNDEIIEEIKLDEPKKVAYVIPKYNLDEVEQ